MAAPGPGPTPQQPAAPPRTGLGGDAARGHVPVASCCTDTHPGEPCSGCDNDRAPDPERAAARRSPVPARTIGEQALSSPGHPRQFPTRGRGRSPHPTVPTRAGLRLQIRQATAQRRAGILLVCAARAPAKRKGKRQTAKSLEIKISSVQLCTHATCFTNEIYCTKDGSHTGCCFIRGPRTESDYTHACSQGHPASSVGVLLCTGGRGPADVDGAPKLSGHEWSFTQQATAAAPPTQQKRHDSHLRTNHPTRPQ